MNERSSDKQRGRRGIVVVMLSLMVAVVLLPMVGLAIDGSILYLIQAKLSAAVDAATLASARSLSVGLDLSSQTASATATAQSFFTADFPSGYWNTTNLQFTTAVAQTAYKTRTVTMVASVTVPLTFMRLLGQTGSTVAAQGQASRRDVVMMVVIDRSSSMANAGVCDTMIAAAQRARWAAVKKRQAQPATPARPKKRKMSAAGLKAIREATKRRWAAYHKAHGSAA